MSRLIHFPSELLTAGGLAGVQPVSVSSLPMDREARLRFIGEQIEKVVVESFEGRHAMTHRTTKEEARRANICVSWFCKLIKEHRWTPDKALSAMRLILSDALDGKAPTITKASAFSPDKTLTL